MRNKLGVIPVVTEDGGPLVVPLQPSHHGMLTAILIESAHIAFSVAYLPSCLLCLRNKLNSVIAKPLIAMGASKLK